MPEERTALIYQPLDTLRSVTRIYLSGSGAVSSPVFISCSYMPTLCRPTVSTTELPTVSAETITGVYSGVIVDSGMR